MIYSKLVDTAYLVTRSPKSLYNALSAATLVITATAPTTNFKLSITASAVTGHTDCSGTVTINGTETLTFTAAATKKTTYTLTSLPTITTAGLDCNLSITCLDTLGAPINTETFTAIACLWIDASVALQGPGGLWTNPKDTMKTDEALVDVGSVIKFDKANRDDPTNGKEYTVLKVKPAMRRGLEDFRTVEFS